MVCMPVLACVFCADLVTLSVYANPVLCLLCYAYLAYCAARCVACRAVLALRACVRACVRTMLCT